MATRTRSVKGKTRIVAKFAEGREYTAPSGAKVGSAVKKNAVLAAGGVAFGLGAATSWAQSFVKALF